MSRLQRTGEILIDLQVVTPTQWDATMAEARDSIEAALRHLSRTVAWWSPPNLPPQRALNQYQIKRMAAKIHKRDWDGLARALRIKSYLLLDKLGEGGMGIVYKAWDFDTKQLVAIKRLKTESVDARKRLRREARIMKRLDHPSIVRCIKLDTLRHSDLLVMEYVNGADLLQEIRTRGPIPWQHVVQWAIWILEALEYAHKRKIIHRDIKAANVILHHTPEGIIPKLLDMGLAKVTEPSLGESTIAGIGKNNTLGTYQYMPPEQWEDSSKVVYQSDFYSLGCTLYYALAGRLPFERDNAAGFCTAHLTEQPPSLRWLIQDIPAQLEALVMQMMAKQPRMRGSHAELILKFRQLAKTGGQGGGSNPSLNPPTSKSNPEVLPSPSGHTVPNPVNSTKVESVSTSSNSPPKPEPSGGIKQPSSGPKQGSTAGSKQTTPTPFPKQVTVISQPTTTGTRTKTKPVKPKRDSVQQQPTVSAAGPSQSTFSPDLQPAAAPQKPSLALATGQLLVTLITGKYAESATESDSDERRKQPRRKAWGAFVRSLKAGLWSLTKPLQYPIRFCIVGLVVFVILLNLVGVWSWDIFR